MHTHHHWTKKRAQREHARKRAMERYGLHYNRHVHREFCDLLAKSKTTKLKDISNRLVMYLVIFSDVCYRILYDKHTKEIATFLPLADSEEYLEELHGE